MLKAITQQTALLSVLFFGALASNAEPVAEESQADSSEVITAIAKRSATTTKVNSDSNTEATKKSAVSLNRDGGYTNGQSDSNLEQELKAFQALDFKNQQTKTRSEMLKHRQSKNQFPQSSGKVQKNGMNHLYIHDAAVLLFDDYDGDGYYSQLRVDFDVDSPYDEYFDVYAELFIRRVGDVEWAHYYTTEVFDIHYNYSSDEYSVTTRLNTGFPPGRYEVLIDLFEYGYSDIVDTLYPYDDYDLTNLALEDRTYESSGVSSDTYINNVKTEIFTDKDDDGFYREFTITFDVNTESSYPRDVYVNLYQRANGTSWSFETETSVFTVDGYSESDAYEINGDWQSGYSPAYYDFRLEVIDADTGEVLDDVSPEFSPLLQVPLEDANNDTRTSTANPPSSTVSSGSGGGNTGLLMLVLLGLFGGWRRKVKP